MTETEKKALALVKAAVSAEQMRILPTYVDKAVLCEALFRAIEQHEAFKREVSDAVDSSILTPETEAHLSRFIIAKPDPLVEALGELADRYMVADQAAATLRAAIEARGGRIVWEGE